MRPCRILFLGVACFLLVAPLGRAEPPSAEALSATIDRLINVRLETSQGTPAQPASDAEFLRRVYLDLVGRIPPIDVASDFLGDPSPDKRGQLVRRLLQSEAHFTHWTNVWRQVMIPPNATASRPNPAFDA